MPKKEEFPTFLNEQPTIIFGRTGRQLLIMVLGMVGGSTLWGAIKDFRPGIGWAILTWTLTSIPILISLVVALVPVAERGLEEWFFVWLFYSMTPKLYLYLAAEEEVEINSNEGRDQDLQKLGPVDPDELEE